ncbi:MAG: hypothetical protein DRJ31_11065 [Candidatus Methanomethylicota archaeon]|uniref:Uncharacterized protein n=1 Tax=Thermoproteota archaeon TaxID=2056631 RepID=A0A497EJT3_9CREN|nr:MAG: hypothetical protein DRJ31_11065 [Candidatus Verstraetearchaeota archaeon]
MDTLLDNVIGFATIIAISILCLGGVLEFQSRIIANTTKYNALMEKAVNLKKILYTTRRLNHAEITNLLSNASANSYILCKINNSLELEVVEGKTPRKPYADRLVVPVGKSLILVVFLW